MTLRGTVIRSSHVRPLVTEMSFACGKCGAATHAVFPDGVFAPPTACAGDGCRSRTFAPNRSSAVSVDWRKVRLQVRGGEQRCLKRATDFWGLGLQAKA